MRKRTNISEHGVMVGDRVRILVDETKARFGRPRADTGTCTAVMTGGLTVSVRVDGNKGPSYFPTHRVVKLPEQRLDGDVADQGVNVGSPGGAAAAPVEGTGELDRGVLTELGDEAT